MKDFPYPIEASEESDHGQQGSYHSFIVKDKHVFGWRKQSHGEESVREHAVPFIPSERITSSSKW